MSAQPPSADFDGCWIHAIFTTYDAWLLGDARGFRARHHCEHIEGDYKNPPSPGIYEENLARSRELLKQSIVRLDATWRPVIGTALRERVGMANAYVLCLAVAATHAHLLFKLPRGVGVRHSMGLAKKHATFEAKAQGWEGKLWAKRGKEIVIASRSHQLRVYRYILRHADQGAWVWDALKDRAR